MANPILAILAGEAPEAEGETDEKNAKKKRRAAEDLIASVKDDDADGVVDAIDALYALCDLGE